MLQGTGHRGPRVERHGVQHGVGEQGGLHRHNGPVQARPLAGDRRLVVCDVPLPKLGRELAQNRLPKVVPRESDDPHEGGLEVSELPGLCIVQVDIQVHLVQDGHEHPLEVAAGEGGEACEALAEHVAQPLRIPASGTVASLPPLLGPVQRADQEGPHRGVVAVVEAEEDPAGLRPHVAAEELHAKLVGPLGGAALDAERKALEQALDG
mmetsp:Transcript_63/g.225  ORF Transcript_63/g.225 Transcript_63/m.225 type:complete len:209 (+) Transcript_63:683-1309(+)